MIIGYILIFIYGLIRLNIFWLYPILYFKQYIPKIDNYHTEGFRNYVYPTFKDWFWLNKKRVYSSDFKNSKEFWDESWKQHWYGKLYKMNMDPKTVYLDPNLSEDQKMLMMINLTHNWAIDQAIEIILEMKEPVSFSRIIEELTKLRTNNIPIKFEDKNRK